MEYEFCILRTESCLRRSPILALPVHHHLLPNRLRAHSSMKSMKLVGREFCALPGGGASAFTGDVDGHSAGPFCAAACTSSAAGAWSTFLGLLLLEPSPAPEPTEPVDPALAERLASAEAEGNPSPPLLPTPPPSPPNEPMELPLGGPVTGAAGAATGAEKSAKSPKSSPRRFVCAAGAGLGLDPPGGGASVGIAKDDESSILRFI